jgi:DNA-binding response OmpR family regulator
MPPKTIMVVDDKLSVQRLVKDYLSEQGYRVVTADNGQDALIVARDESPDLILLDLMMPEMDGYGFIRNYRKTSDAPIILLTARLDETDKVLGLELGADDYVTKPFRMKELVARIRAILRRAEKAATKDENEILQVADLRLDKARYTVTVAEEYINLTRSEFEILALLMETPGRVYSRAELLEYLQGHDGEGVERTIDVHIRNLRSKIEPDPKSPQYIETVFGVGYRCSADFVER